MQSGLERTLFLAAAGLVAGAMNAMAGGGSFVSLPALMLVGLPAVSANATSTLALFPGGLASVLAYRHDFRAFSQVPLAWLLAASLAGGAFGAWLLLATPSGAFDAALPWLLLVASLAFAFGGRAGAALRRHVRIGAAPVLGAQLLLGVYGGYFGGAAGIMMMAVWGLLEQAEPKAMNPAKTLLVAASNAVAVVIFAAAGAVRWPAALAVLAGALLGGYGGARLARRLAVGLIRALVIAITAAMTLAFLLRPLLRPLLQPL
jgi:uncharacterized membrane protein YfcA